MSHRERRMGMVLGIVGGILVVWRFGIPAVNERLFAIKSENAGLRQRLEKLDVQLADVEQSRLVYREYVERTGFTDAAEFKNPFYDKLNQLANAAQLGSLRMQPSAITVYKPPNSRKKTDIKLVRFSINADGTLEKITEFLKAFYELPEIAQVTSLKLDAPSGRARKRQGSVHMRATVEALVPPYHSVGGVNPELLEQPEYYVKHRGQNYAMIGERDPFKEYQAPRPPPITRVREPVVKAPEPPEPEEVPVGDPEAANKVIRMALIYGTDERRVDELLVDNTRELTWEYVSLGDDLDGGVLRLVHPWGAVTRREDGEERMYPTGRTLAESMLFEDSVAAYPEVGFAYRELLAREEEVAERIGPVRKLENEEEKSSRAGPVSTKNTDGVGGDGDGKEAKGVPTASESPKAAVGSEPDESKVEVTKRAHHQESKAAEAKAKDEKGKPGGGQPAEGSSKDDKPKPETVEPKGGKPDNGQPAKSEPKKGESEKPGPNKAKARQANRTRMTIKSDDWVMSSSLV